MIVLVRQGFSQLPGGAAQLAQLVPQLVPSQLLWGESGGWLILALAVGVLAVGLVHAVVAVLAGRRGSSFLAAWFATIAAGAVVGLAFDLDAAARRARCGHRASGHADPAHELLG